MYHGRNHVKDESGQNFMKEYSHIDALSYYDMVGLMRDGVERLPKDAAYVAFLKSMSM